MLKEREHSHDSWVKVGWGLGRDGLNEIESQENPSGEQET